ncbi:hypothetical protein GOP47_0017477 [Adiantum capillus-veneris]|uniref:Serine acetyltransferase N-terminal domain-containing protein n=1 Tax=Adiantum capillus-veneris TaxID=13818 RepID=A0A9D4UFG1_ADICA|nr:hypothetical protein GOP47_0017477 [Adiantum capillus-veneris]
MAPRTLALQTYSSRPFQLPHARDSRRRWLVSFAYSKTKVFPAVSHAFKHRPPQAREKDHVWEQLRQEALGQSEEEPHLASYFYATVLVHSSLERSLAFHLANKLASLTLLSTQLFTLFWETFAEDSEIQEALRSDIRAFKERDPACTSYVHGMLNYKGFLACEAHRIAHRLWGQGRFALALALQNRISEVFHVDIHPGAQIGKGVLFDHATGAILLGSITVGDGAKVGACSLVLINVPPHTTAIGVPAQILGREGKSAATPSKEELPALSMDHTSLILDYII